MWSEGEFIQNALVAADIALAGVNNIINADEVIEAMYRVGRQMPRKLREAGLGGIADTHTGITIKSKKERNSESNKQLLEILWSS